MDTIGNHAKSPTMTHPINHKLTQRRKDRDDLRNRVAAQVDGLEKMRVEEVSIDGEIRGLEEAWAIISKEMAQMAQQKKPAKRSTGTRAKRREYIKWPKVMKAVSERTGATFAYDDVISASRQLGYDPPRSNVRSQMVAYHRDKKWIDKVANGIFKFTELGLSELGVKSPGQDREQTDLSNKKAPLAGGASELGRATTQPIESYEGSRLHS